MCEHGTAPDEKVHPARSPGWRLFHACWGLLGIAILAYVAIMIVSFEMQWVPVPPDTLNTLETGMTEAQVRNTLGPPSEIEPARGSYRWVYERWWSWGYAVVSFDAEGKLTGYYQDDF